MRKLVLPITFLLLAGCRGGFFEAADYVVHVDSIVAPSEIASTEPLTLRFYGTVGQTDCFSFGRFETEKEPDLLLVRVWGRYESRGRCALREVRLDGAPLEVSPPFTDPFVVMVFQPEDEPLTYEINVR